MDETFRDATLAVVLCFCECCFVFPLRKNNNLIRGDQSDLPNVNFFSPKSEVIENQFMIGNYG